MLPTLAWIRREALVEAAGIEPASLVFEEWRRRATFVVKSKKGKGFGSNLLSP